MSLSICSQRAVSLRSIAPNYAGVDGAASAPMASRRPWKAGSFNTFVTAVLIRAGIHGDLLAPCFRQLRAEVARDDVGRGARDGSNDHADGAGGILLRSGGGCNEQCRRRGNA